MSCGENSDPGVTVSSVSTSKPRRKCDKVTAATRINSYTTLIPLITLYPLALHWPLSLCIKPHQQLVQPRSASSGRV